MDERRLSGGRAGQETKQGSTAKRPSPRAARNSRPSRATGRRTYQQKIGRRAEDIAAEYLRAQGLEIVERNYLRRLGELDIVARQGDTLVVAEVRTRATDRYGGAAASVSVGKRRRLIRTAAQLLQQRKDLTHLRVRFDVVAVSATDTQTPHVDWIRHAFLT